jgi:hypothetical protein
LQFPTGTNGYIDWMGKCQDYSPSCEWESRMYSTTNSQGRCNRLSAYAFNPGAGLGSGADWQPNCGLLQAGQWLHVVGEYQTLTTPAGCNAAYPGSLSIWVNGVPWNMSYHTPTGCMSQYSVTPTVGNSPLNIGTMALDYWFPGAIGKVAIYNYLLTQSQISAHFTAMAGAAPSGSCTNTCTTLVPTQTGTVATATPAPTPTPTPVTTHTPTPANTPLPTATPNTGRSLGTPSPSPSAHPASATTPQSNTIVSVDAAPPSASSSLDTRYLTNGLHTVTTRENGVTTTRTINVQNNLSPLQQIRNTVFAGFHGNKTLINGTLGAFGLIIGLTGLYLTVSRIRRWLASTSSR